MRELKSLGAAMSGISMIAAIIFATVLLINGSDYVGTIVFPYFLSTVVILVVVCITILFPLSLFRRTRVIPAYGFFIFSFVIGLCTWMSGFLTTYDIWGTKGIVTGILLGGVGVVPLGVIAAAFQSEWAPVNEIVIGLMLTFGAHFFSLFLVAKIDEDKAATLPTID